MQNKLIGSIRFDKEDTNSMLRILMANPIQLTRVKAVPLRSGGTEEATRVENCGESVETAMPHRPKAPRNKKGES